MMGLLFAWIVSVVLFPASIFSRHSPLAADQLDWKWVNVDFLDGHGNEQQHTTPAVSASLSPGDLGRAGASGTGGTNSYTRSR